MIAQLGVKKGWATPRQVSFRGFIPNFEEHPRPFHMGFHPGPYVRESKTILDTGFCANDSGLKVLDSGFFVSGTWIPDYLSCIPDSKALERDLVLPRKQKFRILLHGAINDVSKQVNNCICCSLCFELPNDKCKIFRFCLTN